MFNSYRQILIKTMSNLIVKIVIEKRYKLHFMQKAKYEKLTIFNPADDLSNLHNERTYAEENPHMFGRIKHIRGTFGESYYGMKYFNLPEKYYNLVKRGFDLKININIDYVESEISTIIYYRKDQYAKLKLMGGFDEY